jgi:hypothetical protein
MPPIIQTTTKKVIFNIPQKPLCVIGYKVELEGQIKLFYAGIII